MARHAHLTVLELGASATAWAAGDALGADDWIVVAQQSDEAAPDFSLRVRQRAQRLRKEDALLDVVDVYAGASDDQRCSAARREVIEDLGTLMAQGGRLTIWSSSNDARADLELAAILTQFGPILAERRIAMLHQAWEPVERSGVRHAAPARPEDADLEFEEFA